MAVGSCLRGRRDENSRLPLPWQWPPPRPGTRRAEAEAAQTALRPYRHHLGIQARGCRACDCRRRQSRLPRLRVVRERPRGMGAEGRARQAAPEREAAAALRVLPGEPDGPGRAQGGSREAPALGAADQEVRRVRRRDRTEQREASRLRLCRPQDPHRRGSQRHVQGARRHRRRRRPAPAHRHVRRDARGNVRGDGGGQHALREVRPRRRPAAERRLGPGQGREGLPADYPPRPHEGLRRRRALPGLHPARSRQGRYRRASATCWRAPATT